MFKNAILNKEALTVSSAPKPAPNIGNIVLKNQQKLYYNHICYLDAVTSSDLSLKNPHGKEHLTLDWNTFLTYFIDYAKLS